MSKLLWIVAGCTAGYLIAANWKSADEAPAAPPEPAAADGGVIGEPLLDAKRRAEEAVDTAVERKREVDEMLEEMQEGDKP